MSYQHGELQIVMVCSGARWHWVLEEVDGEVIRNGSHGDFEDAAKAAMRAYDWERLKP